MAVKKDAAFYRKQRLDDEAKAKKGDKKAKAELAQIEAKRVKARGASSKPKAPAAAKSSGSYNASPVGKALNEDAASSTAKGDRAMKEGRAKGMADYKSQKPMVGNVGSAIGKWWQGTPLAKGEKKKG